MSSDEPSEASCLVDPVISDGCIINEIIGQMSAGQPSIATPDDRGYLFKPSG